MGIDAYSRLLLLKGTSDKVGKVSAKDLSNISKYSVDSYRVRCVDEVDKGVSHSTVHEIFFYPPQRMIVLETEDEYSIAITPDTEVYTLYGWMKAGDLRVGDMVYTNGIDIPPYRDKETLRRLYYDEHLTQKQIADRLGIAERTIRYYIHIYGLEKGCVHKMMGAENPRYKGDDVSKRGGYDRTHELYDKYKTGVCERCGRTLPTQLHHINRDPTDVSRENLMELCDLCHAMEHHGFVIKWVRPGRITKIRYGGTKESLGFSLYDATNVVIEGFVLRFDKEGAETVKEYERTWRRVSSEGRIAD